MNGVFYVATGAKFRAEAVESVQSLKHWNPKLHVTLYSDQTPETGQFDRVVVIPNPKMTGQDKVDCFSLVEYDKAIFLDADTLITGDLSGLFALVETFDIAAMMDSLRGYWYQDWSLPEWFPEVNAGVVVFRNTAQVKRLFANWLALYEASKSWQARQHRVWDQPSLRRSLLEAKDIRLTHLPTEFNTMLQHGTYVFGSVKVIHGRKNVKALAKQINCHPGIERSLFQGEIAVPDFRRITYGEVLKILFRINVYTISQLSKRFLMRFIKPAKRLL